MTPTDKSARFAEVDELNADYWQHRDEQTRAVEAIEATAKPGDVVRDEMVEALLDDECPEHVEKMANPAEFAAAMRLKMAVADRHQRTARLMSMAANLVAPYWPDGGSMADAIAAAPVLVAADAIALMAGHEAMAESIDEIEDFRMNGYTP